MIHFHCFKTGARSLRAAASGNSRTVPIAVRKRTRLAGLSSVTAILMKRYGIPQMRAIATKRIQPRRVTRSRYRCATAPFIASFTPVGLRARKRPDPSLEVLLLDEELLLLRQLRVPRRLGAAAGLACDPRDLPIHALEVVSEPLKLRGSDGRRRRCFGRRSRRRLGRRGLGRRARRRLAGGAAFVLDPLSIGREAGRHYRGVVSPGPRSATTGGVGVWLSALRNDRRRRPASFSSTRKTCRRIGTTSRPIYRRRSRRHSIPARGSPSGRRTSLRSFRWS